MASLPSPPIASETAAAQRVVILGAAGRDFSRFQNGLSRRRFETRRPLHRNPDPGIADRRYPPALAGPLYPDGIPIIAEDRIEEICRAQDVDEVAFAYNDVPHEHVMHLASRALALGADFTLLGPARTMLRSSLPVIAVTAVRTGCGKSPIARFIAGCLRERGKRVAVLRHPMPYGDLVAERVQRFASLSDLDRAHCTIEEREEYEPHIAMGNLVFAGVDYAAILAAAEGESDVIVWDGGNNDFPFIRPDLHIAVADALRPAQVTTHHPGEWRAWPTCSSSTRLMRRQAPIRRPDRALPGDQPARDDPSRRIAVRLDNSAAIRGRRVLVVEDGPTITHDGMAHGAGLVAARAASAAEIVDPRASAPAEIAAVFAAYPHIGPVLPAVGYSPA